MESSYSESELDNLDCSTLARSLRTHSHFFAPPHYRYSAPLLDCSASPVSPLSKSNSSSDKLECLEGTLDGHRYENRDSLAHDLSFLATMPELCDVTFMVGEDRQPVCAVRAILAARSRVFRRMLYGEGNIGGKRSKKKQNFKPSDGYIEKYDFRGQPTVVVKDFEPEVFKQLVEYTHTGSVMLQARTLLGLMNAADHYGLEELKQACIRFMEHCVNTDTVCSLLSSAEKYIQYKSTKILVQKMFEFVDQNAEVILSLGAFSTLPQHVVRIVLGREDLNAAEISKFNAAFKWSIKFCDDRPDITLKQAFEPFVDVINFFQIPAKQLMRNIKPAEVIDDAIILNALAYQADPRSVDHIQLPNRPRKSTYCSTGTKYVSPMFRRVQSSGQSLANGSCRRLPPSDPRKVRSGSVPPLEHSRSEEKRVLQSEVHPARIHDVRPESRDSHLSSSPAVSSPKSPSSDSYQESVSSLGGTESESHETPTHSQRRFSYSTLDDIVTLSSKAVEV